MDVPTLAYASPRSTPIPVRGVVIARSPIKAVGMLVGYGFMFMLAAFFVWATITHQVLDRGTQPKTVSPYGFLLGVGGVLLTPMLAYRLLRSLWTRERIVIGADRLQVVEGGRGREVVTLQVPYANVVVVRYETNLQVRRVGIVLRDVDDAETYAGGHNFRQHRDATGWHLCFAGGYRRGPRTIAAAIERAREAWTGGVDPIGGRRRTW